MSEPANTTSAVPTITVTLPQDGFSALIDKTIGVEGGYSNDPNDTGGETIWGITWAEARAYGYTGLIKDMPRETAVLIYRQRYVVEPGWDKLYPYDPILTARLFDIGVNMGPGEAGTFLQRALNVLNYNQSVYQNLRVDGSVGPMTRAALSAFYTARGDTGKHVLYGMVAAQQSVRYIEIAEGNPTQEEFEYGWQAARVIGMAAYGA